jgi:hypothetical protein
MLDMNFLLAEMDRLPVSTSTTSTTETSSTTIRSFSPHTETLVQLCRLWPHLHNPAPDPPPFCQDLLPSGSWQLNPPSLPDVHDSYITHFGAGKPGERMVGLDHEQNGFQYTGRSLSLISVLGGILVILVIIAFISCYKHRKRVAAGESFSVDLFATHIRNLSSAQQLQLLGRQPDDSACPGPPPDYETVVKQREEEESGLPTYSVAVERRNTVELKRAFEPDVDYDDDDDDTVIVEENDDDLSTRDNGHRRDVTVTSIVMVDQSTCDNESASRTKMAVKGQQDSEEKVA